MTRRKPLARKKPIAPKRRKPRRSARVRDEAYLAAVRRLTCVAPFFWHDCAGPLGPVEAHHAGPRAAGRKADDDTAIPLCVVAHRAWHDATGPFRGWSLGLRREWAAQKIAETRALVRARLGRAAS